jgi:laccase
MHCHFDRHLSWGMDTVFIVKNGPTAATSIRDRPTNLPPCRFKSLLHDLFLVIDGKVNKSDV